MAFFAFSAIVACKDDASDITFRIGEDGVSEVSINRLGGCISVPVQANGKWTASLPEDCDWAGLGTNGGNSSGNIEIYVDYANPTYVKSDRSTQLTVTSGGDSRILRLRQYVGLSDGENAAYNDSTGFSDLYKASFFPTIKAVERVKIEIPIDKSVAEIVNIRDRKPSY